MRSIVPLAVIVLAACTANQQVAEAASDHGRPPQATAIHGVTPGHKCATRGTEKFIGAAGTSQAGAAIKRASKASSRTSTSDTTPAPQNAEKRRASRLRRSICFPLAGCYLVTV